MDERRIRCFTGGTSGAAEGLMHNLVGLRRVGVIGEFRLVIKRPRENREQFFERRKIAANRSRNCLFHAVIARDEQRIDGDAWLLRVLCCLALLPPSAGAISEAHTS
jgi:hypothetical protein